MKQKYRILDQNLFRLSAEVALHTDVEICPIWIILQNVITFLEGKFYPLQCKPLMFSIVNNSVVK